MTITDQAIDMVPIDELIEHPDNPRRGNTDDVEASIRQHGFYGVILRQASTGFVVVGNTRLRAARAVGLTELPVETREMTDGVAKRIMLRDNRSSELGTFDADALDAGDHAVAVLDADGTLVVSHAGLPLHYCTPPGSTGVYVSSTPFHDSTPVPEGAVYRLGQARQRKAVA